MARRRVPMDAELDVIPIMSLIVHLIPMILLSVQFVRLTQIPTNEPILRSEVAPSEAAYAEQEQQVVSLRITAEGFVVGGAEGADPRIPCAGSCAPDTYDYAALAFVMARAKRLHPTETRVVIAPEPTIPYDVVARAMSAARGEDGRLFPAPLLAAP